MKKIAFAIVMATMMLPWCVTIIPVITVYLLLQKRFVDGIAASGLKG